MKHTTEPLKIGLVADKLNVLQGGSNFSLDLIARTLVEHGHTVTILTVNFTHENEFSQNLPYEVIEAPVENGSRATNAHGVYNRLKQFEDQFDVYHIFNPALHPIAGAYRSRHETPVVGRLNTYDVFCTNLPLMDGECHRNCTVSRKFAHSDLSVQNKLMNLPKYIFDTHAFPSYTNKLDRLFAVSPSVKSIYGDIGVDTDNIRVVPNFYDPAFELGDEDVYEFDHEKTALYVGSMKEFKGPHLLVDAISELPENCGVALIGEGPAHEVIEQRARDRGVIDRVTLLGWIDHKKLPRYYCGADVFVHPGLYPEPFNRTILESMQCGCPPIVSDVGGPPWVVENCGRTFERGNVTELATKLKELLLDESMQLELQSKCTDRLADFTPDRTVRQLVNQYRQVL